MMQAGFDDDFLDWWFAPWTYAPHAASLPHCDGQLGARDAYASWCAQAGVARGLPADADPRWRQAALRDAGLLMTAAELFGGLFAARERRPDALAALAPALRRWCLGVASTQPLQRWVEAPAAFSLSHLGLAELAARLEAAFPGMWPRLRLLLPRADLEQVARAMPAQANGAAPRERERQCWLMCLVRAGGA